MPCRHRRVDVKFYTFSTLALHMSDQLHAMAALPLKERAPNTHWTEGYDGRDKCPYS
jgi:hypothetical protein